MKWDHSSCIHFGAKVPFWAAAPKGHESLKFALPALTKALQALNEPPPASDLTSRPHVCPPPDLQLALQASNQHSVAQIRPQNFKSALQALILPPAFKYAFFGLNQSSKA